MRTILICGIFFSLSSLSEVFVISDRLKPDVDFWRKVYSEWDTHQVVFYDSSTKFVYDVLNLPKVENELSSQKFRKIVEEHNKNIVKILDAAGSKEVKNLSPLAMRVMAVVKQHGLSSEPDLSLRMRRQNGLRSQFEFGLATSGRYADDMKAILRSQKLPEDLLAMVFVESLFHLSSVSHAGATGPWGFLKETAKASGIHVNRFTDERLDPVISTWAAARYINKAKAGLSEWPLIITSYNYGYSGMMRAVNNLGTRDFDVIVDNHESPIFGYASKSYYTGIFGGP